jgi:hypothetical protein
MELDLKRLEQLIEDIHSEGWYTQAEELNKLLDAYKAIMRRVTVDRGRS